jgi:integrase
LRGARSKKKIILGENERRVDFDKDKAQAMTLSRWGDTYLSLYAREKKSLVDDERHVRHLCRILGGNLLLSQISLDHVEHFKQTRKTERHGGKPISETTIDRSLAVLRHMPRLAEEKGVIERVPRVKLYKPDNGRERILSEEEYGRLLAASPVHLRHIVLCAYETGMRAGEIQYLTWDKVDLKTGFIRLAADDTKTNKKRAIPISLVLRETLEDIRREQREGKVTR